MKSTIDRMMEDPEFRKLFAQEGLIIEFQEELAKRMLHQGVDKKELAKLLECSPSTVTRMLGGHNLSVRTMAKAFYALGATVVLSIKEIPTEAPTEG